ncbi:MAG: phage tail tape measure protein, partial [Planktothrix sp.]
MAMQEFGAILTAKDNFSDVLNKAGRNMESFASRTDKGMVLLGGAIAGVGVLATKFGADAVKKFIGFEKAMLNVKAVSGATKEEFEQLKKMALKMGETTAFSAQESAEAFYYMSTAGFTVKQTMASLPSIMELASAAAMDFGKTADIVTDSMGTFGLLVDDVGQMTRNTKMFVDVLAKASNISNLDVTMLGESFSVVGGNAKNMGYDVQTTTALLVAMGNSVKGSQAGTALSTVFRNLIAKSKDGKMEINKMLVSVVDAQGKFRKLQDILEDVGKATEKLTGPQRQDVLMQV